MLDGLTVQEDIETFLNGHASLYLGLLFVPGGLLGTVREDSAGRRRNGSLCDSGRSGSEASPALNGPDPAFRGHFQ